MVLPTYNNLHVLPKALESLWAQSYKDIEILVIDGGSNDGTKEYLESISHKLAYWRSEKDSGSTEALNIGFKKSSGDIVTFFAADDQFADASIFADAAQYFERNPEAELLLGNLRVVDPKDPLFEYVSKSNPSGMWRRMSVHMPGAFLRRHIMADRQFDSRLEFGNDYELFSFLIQKKKVNVRYWDRITIIFAMGGLSNSVKPDFSKARDCFYVRRTYYSWSIGLCFYVRDLAVGVLRRMHFRPLSWGRKIRLKWHQLHS